MGLWSEELATHPRETVVHYKYYFSKLLERWGLTADGLYELKLSSLRSGDPRDPRDHRRVEAMAKTLMVEMRQRARRQPSPECTGPVLC